MGLSTKQASSDNDGFDWNHRLLQDQRLLPMKRQLHHHHHQQQQQQQQKSRSQPMTSSEQVKCPRCGSANTKFCYFNNYNKSQPRHFCKACKRHWTKGGTLRNLPVGGGRKNKRPRTKTSPSSKSTASATSAATSLVSNQIDQHPMQLIHPPQSSLLLQPAYMNYNDWDAKNLFNTAAIADPVLQVLNDIYRSSSCSSPFEVSSWQHPIITGTATMPMNLSCHQPWNFGSSCIETASSNLNWDEFDKLVSGNPSLPWDDPALHIKP